MSSLILDAASALIGHASTLVEGAYSRAPTLVLALTALLVLPTVAVVSLAAQASRRYGSRRSAIRAAARGATAEAASTGDLSADIPDTAGLPMRSQAWLTVEGAGGTVALEGQVIRIGRHQDNDIRLADRSVQRYHAVIERTPEEAFLLTDVSGKASSGVRINGQRTDRAQLADGDVIELGRARLIFENAPV